MCRKFLPPLPFQGKLLDAFLQERVWLRAIFSAETCFAGTPLRVTFVDWWLLLYCLKSKVVKCFLFSYFWLTFGLLYNLQLLVYCREELSCTMDLSVIFFNCHCKTGLVGIRIWKHWCDNTTQHNRWENWKERTIEETRTAALTRRSTLKTHGKILNLFTIVFHVMWRVRASFVIY